MKAESRIVPYRGEHSAPVLELLKQFSRNSPNIGERDFERLLTSGWSDGEPPRGFVLQAGSRVVGFISTLFSDRTLDGKQRRFCNMNTWIVQPEHRGDSMLLLKPILNLADHTITCMTPSPHVYPILRRLGFEDLETSTTLLFPKICRPLPPPSKLFDFSRIRETRGNTGVELPEEIKSVMRDHTCGPTASFVATDGTEFCLIVYVGTTSYRFRYAVLLHVGNPRFFREHIHAIRYRLWRSTGIMRMMTDTRLLAGYEIPGAETVPLKTVRLYRSTELDPLRIDNLYSESVILSDY